MLIPPRSSHCFRIFGVRDDGDVIREVILADGAYPAVLDDLSVQKFPRLCP